MFKGIISGILMLLLAIVGGVAILWYSNMHVSHQMGSVHLGNFDLKEKVTVYTVNDDFLYDINPNDSSKKFVALQGLQALFVADMSKARKVEKNGSEEIWHIPLIIEIRRDPAKRIINDVSLENTPEIEATENFISQYLKYRMAKEDLIDHARQVGERLLADFISQAYSAQDKNKLITVSLEQPSGQTKNLEGQPFHMKGRAYSLDLPSNLTDWQFHNISVFNPVLTSIEGISKKYGKIEVQTIGFQDDDILERYCHEANVKLFDPTQGEKGKFFYVKPIKIDGKQAESICFGTDDGYFHEVLYKWEGKSQVKYGLATAMQVAFGLSHNREQLIKQFLSETKTWSNDKVKSKMFDFDFMNKISTSDFDPSGVSSYIWTKLENRNTFFEGFIKNISRYAGIDCISSMGKTICGDIGDKRPIFSSLSQTHHLNPAQLKFLKEMASSNYTGNLEFFEIDSWEKRKVIEEHFWDDDDIEPANFKNIGNLIIDLNSPVRVSGKFYSVFHPDCNGSGKYKDTCQETPSKSIISKTIDEAPEDWFRSENINFAWKRLKDTLIEMEGKIKPFIKNKPESDLQSIQTKEIM